MQAAPSLRLFAAAAALACCAGAQATSQYAATRYPIVLAHGAAGFKNIGPVDYWYGITKDLQANGAKVYNTQVSAWNSSDVRGEQFLTEFRKILAVSGAKKVNLIGHSQGAQTVRYAAAAMPDRVASITTINGVNYASPVADVFVGLSDALGPQGTKLVASFFNAIGVMEAFFSGQPGQPQDALGTMNSMSTPGANAFNQRFPAGLPSQACGQGPASANGWKLYSWGSTKVSTNLLDPLDWMLAVTTLAFKNEANDGLVGKCASHFGTVIRDDYPFNHFDAVNQALGLRGSYDPLPLHRQHANRLKLQGL